MQTKQTKNGAQMSSKIFTISHHDTLTTQKTMSPTMINGAKMMPRTMAHGRNTALPTFLALVLHALRLAAHLAFLASLLASRLTIFSCFWFA